MQTLETITGTVTVTEGQEVRIYDAYGSCLKGRLIKINRKTVEVESFGKLPLRNVHTTRCIHCDPRYD